MNRYNLCRLLSIVAILPALATVVPAQDSGSLLVNGGFESGSGDSLPGWTRAFYPQRDGINRCVGPSTEQTHSGKRSLKIDTASVLGEETTLVFNDSVSREATAMHGKTLVLTGWIYVKPGTALRPIGMVLRAFGKDRAGKSVFLGPIFERKVLGSAGKWTQFRLSGRVLDADIAQIDLHCGIRPDIVPTVQFLDDLRLELLAPPPLEVRLLRDALWSDEPVLPVEVRLSPEPEKGTGTSATRSQPPFPPAGASLTLRLIDAQEHTVAEWKREAKSGVVGLDLPKVPLAPGRLAVQAELRGSGRTLASATAALEVAESPWKDAPAATPISPMSALRSTPGEVPEGFRILGTTAPTTAKDDSGAMPALSESWSESRAISDTATVAIPSYFVFSRHYLDPVSRTGRPWPGENRPIRLFACPGQYEPTTISVWARKAQSAVRVRVSDLSGPAGSITAPNIDVRLVRTIRGLPPFLEKRPTVDIPEGQTRTFWLTIRVPPDAAPGYYRGQIEVATQHGDATRRDLLLRVLPLRLPPPQKGYGFWWSMDRRWNGYETKDPQKALETIRKHFILLREHNCNMVSTHAMPKMTRAADGTLHFDFSQDHWGHNAYSPADFFRLGRETRFLSPQVPIQFPGADSLHSDWIARAVKLDRDSPAFDEFYRDACRRVDAWVKSQGFTLAFACVDEIGNSLERRQTALRFYRDAQQAGVLTSVTDNSMHGGVHLMGQPRFDQIIAMRLYNFITPEMIDDTRRAGDHLWLYNLASGGRDARLDRFVFGRFTERCGAEGCAQWAFQWPKANTNPYEAAAATGSSGYHYALPAPDGPLPTTALEGVREGIDDARYLALLPKDAQAALLKDVEPVSTTIDDQVDGHTGNYFDVLRWRAAKEALRTAGQQ